jgi:hypothetical protein
MLQKQHPFDNPQIFSALKTRIAGMPSGPLLHRDSCRPRGKLSVARFYGSWGSSFQLRCRDLLICSRLSPLCSSFDNSQEKKPPDPEIQDRGLKNQKPLRDRSRHSVCVLFMSDSFAPIFDSDDQTVRFYNGALCR